MNADQLSTIISYSVKPVSNIIFAAFWAQAVEDLMTASYNRQRWLPGY